MDQDRLPVRLTGDLDAEFTPAADRYDPGLDLDGHWKSALSRVLYTLVK
jgi:hypothetical protein